jgi:hypothetical protein
MSETIVNIFLIIESGSVVELRAKKYEADGTDDSKIGFLKERAREDYEPAEIFDAPRNRRGEFMPYKKFSKLESQGMHYRLFEEIFTRYRVPQNPLICVTPVVDGEVWAK